MSAAVGPAGAGSAVAVGLCLVEGGAEVAVLRPNPLRLTAVASVTWPPSHQPAEAPGPGPVPRRVLARARRQLALPKWTPVAVVPGPDRAGPVAAVTGPAPPAIECALAPAPHTAELLARAGLAQAGAIAPEQAARQWAAAEIMVDPELAPLLSGRAAELAVGAALALLRPGDTGTGTPDGIDREESAERVGGFSGWAVQQFQEVGEPAGAAATKLR